MKLNYKKIFAVGLAFFLISMFWQAYDNIIAKILIDKFGLNQTWSGAVMALDNVLALFLLPLFGALSDRKNSKLGRRTPFIIIGTVIAAFAFMTMSFVDNYQTLKVQTTTTSESGTTIVEDYTALKTTDITEVADWTIAITDMKTERDAALAAATITQSQYDKWESDIYDDMTAILDANPTTLDQDALDDLNDLYYSYYSEQAWHWNDVITSMFNERVAAYDNGDITFSQLNKWEEKILIPMQEVLSENPDGLSTFDVNDLNDLYYNYLSERAWQITASNPTNFIVFMMVLLVALVAMSTFRSPAVALMPDVTIKPLRSKANAIINLMGTLGGLLILILLKIYGMDNLSYVHYTGAFISVGILMLIVLGVFLWRVKEPKLVKEKEEEEKRYGLTEEEEAKEVGETIEELSTDKKKSLYLILFSVFLWFVGYNAVTSKFSDYAPKVLELGYSMPLMIAYATALLSFIPIGIVATKIGRRKTIMIGIVILTLCFGSAAFLTKNSSWIMYIIFGLTGIGWATINVNSYPMVVELSKNSNVGKYTGYYYAFSMAAQIITPIFSGFLMDKIGRIALFPYGAFFVACAFITMIFVKYGDAKPVKKEDILENFDVDMD
ncbi:MAG TPA: MFS transporter [Candidatus Izemoplasmatales bacterium]|nr:MFS transporter [Candidatus Izemoplasmatales bacterium]